MEGRRKMKTFLCWRSICSGTLAGIVCASSLLVLWVLASDAKRTALPRRARFPGPVGPGRKKPRGPAHGAEWAFFCPIWRRPYMSVNRETYVHDMLACAGGANIFADRSARYPGVTLGEMAAAKPEVILLPDEPYHFRKPHLRDFEEYPEVPAVRDQRIHFVDGKLLSWYGPRIAEALHMLPALLSSETPS